MSVYGGSTLFGGALFGGEPVPFLFQQIDAETTVYGRYLLALGSTDGMSVRCTGFAVGRGGFDPNDYLAAVPVNPDATALDDQVFTDSIDLLEEPNNQCCSCYCVLETGEANVSLGEIAIIAQVQNSAGDPADGTEFVLAIGHFPMVAKNSDIRYAFRVTIQA